MAKSLCSLYENNGVPQSDEYQKIKNRLIPIGQDSPDSVAETLRITPAGRGYSVSLDIGGSTFKTTIRLKETVEESYNLFLLTGDGKAHKLTFSLNGDYSISQVFFWRIFSPKHITSWHIGGLTLESMGCHPTSSGDMTYHYVVETLGETWSEKYQEIEEQLRSNSLQHL